MIKIANSSIDPNTIKANFMQNSVENKILDILIASREVYNYGSQNQLLFELKLRKSIVNAAKDLNKSRFSFRIFRKSICNKNYWNRTNDGGFDLKDGVKPSEAINDIYIHSSLYGTECATAIIIVYYKALVDVFPEEQFNRLFSGIYLMNWQHLDPDLGISDFMRPADYLPGDCRYFKNPDVDPLKPEWQGENTFLLDNGLYYGHGLGIATGEKIIDELNKKRIHGSTTSAYLMNSVKRLNFRYLGSKYYNI